MSAIGMSAIGMRRSGCPRSECLESGCPDRRGLAARRPSNECGAGMRASGPCRSTAPSPAPRRGHTEPPPPPISRHSENSTSSGCSRRPAELRSRSMRRLSWPGTVNKVRDPSLFVVTTCDPSSCSPSPSPLGSHAAFRKNSMRYRWSRGTPAPPRVGNSPLTWRFAPDGVADSRTGKFSWSTGPGGLFGVTPSSRVSIPRPALAEIWLPKCRRRRWLHRSPRRRRCRGTDHVAPNDAVRRAVVEDASSVA